MASGSVQSSVILSLEGAVVYFLLYIGISVHSLCDFHLTWKLGTVSYHFYQGPLHYVKVNHLLSIY